MMITVVIVWIVRACFMALIVAVKTTLQGHIGTAVDKVSLVEVFCGHYCS